MGKNVIVGSQIFFSPYSVIRKKKFIHILGIGLGISGFRCLVSGLSLSSEVNSHWPTNIVSIDIGVTKTTRVIIGDERISV